MANEITVAVGHPQPTSELVKFQASTKRRVRSTKRMVLVGEGMSVTCLTALAPPPVFKEGVGGW